jgi:hypothetical protein
MDVDMIDLNSFMSDFDYNQKSVQQYGGNDGDTKLVEVIKDKFHLKDHYVMSVPGGMATLDLVINSLSEDNFWIPKYHWGSWNKILKIHNKNTQEFDDFNIANFKASDPTLGYSGVVMLCYPSNPTGWSPDFEDLKKFLDHSKEHNITVILDLPYYYLFNDIDNPIHELFYDNVIVISSFSKSMGLSGLRIGYIATKNQELYNSMTEDKSIDNDVNVDLCLITNLPLKDRFVELKCGHKFNYGPLYKDILTHKKKFNNMELVKTKLKYNEIRCPYCRNVQNELLPYYEELSYPKEHGVNFFDVNKSNTYCECINSSNQCQYETEIVDSESNIQVQKCFQYGYVHYLLKNKYNNTNKYCYTHKLAVVKGTKEKIKNEKQKEKLEIKQKKLEEKNKLKEELKEKKLQEKIKRAGGKEPPPEVERHTHTKGLIGTWLGG